MDETKKIAEDVFKKGLNDSQYGVSDIPYHMHTGVDSPQVNAKDIINMTKISVSGSTELTGSVTFAAGNGLTVSQSGQTITYSSSAGTLDVFGDGSDGDLTASSGTTTLTKDTYYNNVTLTGTAKIDPAGYSLFIKGTYTNGTNGGGDTSGIIRTGNAGSAGSSSTNNVGAAGGAGGTALTGNTVPNGLAGTVGGTGANAQTNLNDEAGVASSAGSNGTASTQSIGGTGSTGVSGGAGGAYAGFVGGNGGAGGTGGTKTSAKTTPSTLFDARYLYNPATLTIDTGSTGAGGGSGGGSGGHAINSTAGGGGGSGGTGSDGGFVCVYAKIIINYVAGGIQAKGGAGGNGGNGGNAVVGLGIGAGGGGGGAGGNGGTGGVVVVLYQTLTQSGSFLASGGAGGTKGNGGNLAGTNSTNGSNGTDGSTGASGLVWQLQLT